MKTEKRVYLSKGKQIEIIENFFTSYGAEKEFSIKDLDRFLAGYDWYIKTPEPAKYARLENLIALMKNSYGERIKRINDGEIGVPAKWVLEGSPKAEPKAKKIEKPAVKKKRGCSLKRVNEFYNLIKIASESKIGISKREIRVCMNYKTKMLTENNIKSLNNLFELETGFRPLIIDKSHKFVDYDVLHVDNEMASLILEELLKKLKGVEPASPVIEDGLEKVVKSTIRKDYDLLKMFKKKSRKLSFRGGGAERFKKSIVGTQTLSASVVAERFQETLDRRYGIKLDIFGLPKGGFELRSSEEDLKDALIKIESIFAEYFCEDIVPREYTEWEKETKRELTPTDQEKSMLGVIERDIFKDKDGDMFLSDMWNSFDTLGIKRGWDLIGLLKKNPEKFKIDYKDHKGYTEVYVRYTAPVIEISEPVVVIPETTASDILPSDVGPENELQQKEEEKKEEIRKEEGGEYQIYFGFTNEEDLIELCKNPSCVQIDKDGEYYMCVFFANNSMDKKTMLELLRLCYISEEAPDKVKMIYYNKKLYKKILEWSILK